MSRKIQKQRKFGVKLLQKAKKLHFENFDVNCESDKKVPVDC